MNDVVRRPAGGRAASLQSRRPQRPTLVAILAGVVAIAAWRGAYPDEAPRLVGRDAADAPEATLTIGQYMFPPGRANPYRSVSPPAPFFWGALFDGLTAVDAEGRLQPALALSWRTADDRTWIFELRPGVTFSNGEKFTAAAVVRNIEALRRPEARGWIVARDAGKLAAGAAGDLTVELRTRDPDPSLPRFLSTLMMVAPDQWDRLGPEQFATHPVGTGPFRLVGDWAGTRLEFTAHRDSWRAPRVSRLVLLDLRDMAERVDKVASGDIDIATIVDPDTRERIEAAGGRLQVRSGTGVVVFAFVLTRESPLKELKVRQALNHAVNRQAIINDFLAGATRPAGAGLRANVPGYDPSIPTYSYDPARARELLARAGYGAGVTLKAEGSAGGGPNQAALLQRVLADLDSVGIRVQMRERPVPELMAYMFRGGWESDMFLMEYNASTGLDPLQPLQLHSCGWMAPWYCNEAMTPLIKAAAVEHDEARRNRLLSDIYRAYHDDASALYLYEAVGFDAIGRDVVDFRAPNGIIDYARVSKRPRKAAERSP